MSLTHTKIEIYLSIGLEHKDGEVAYAGNHDERMSVFISGHSYLERYGCEQGMKAFKELVKPNVDMIGAFDYMHTDHGENIYQLDPANYNRLYMKFGSHLTLDDVMVMLNKLWPCIEGVYLSDDPVGANPVCIKDFVISTKEIITIDNEFIFTPETT